MCLILEMYLILKDILFYSAFLLIKTIIDCISLARQKRMPTRIASTT